MSTASVPRTTLRAFEERDLELLCALRNNVELQFQLASRPRPNSIERVREWVQRHLSDSNALFYVVSNSNGVACGFIQLTEIDLINGTARLGICIAPSRQRQGHAGRALRLLEGRARAVFPLRKIMLTVLTSNVKAIELYRRAAFDEVGIHRQHYYAENRYHDVLVMEKLL